MKLKMCRRGVSDLVSKLGDGKRIFICVGELAQERAAFEFYNVLDG